MNPNVNPVQSREARKAQTRAKLAMMKLTQPMARQEKLMLKAINKAKETRAAQVRAATPEIASLDLINEKRKALRIIDETVDREIINLRRRLVTAEKLVVTRTRERDSANQAHKTRVRVADEQLAARDKKIDDLRKDKTMLHNKIAQLETELARKNHKKTPVTVTNTVTPNTPGNNANGTTQTNN